MAYHTATQPCTYLTADAGKTLYKFLIIIGDLHKPCVAVTVIYASVWLGLHAGVKQYV